mmetsp:Transcript_67934/g.76057  ORF Transcript_67934/g.76057 Transcript_67934/m.76057 type:complete len:87 (-) Transcript_67934:541-801(-)
MNTAGRDVLPVHFASSARIAFPFLPNVSNSIILIWQPEDNNNSSSPISCNNRALAATHHGQSTNEYISIWWLDTWSSISCRTTDSS